MFARDSVSGSILCIFLFNVKAGIKLATDRAHVIRQAIFCCRKGGTVSVPGVYVGLIDKMPFGATVNKAARTGKIGDGKVFVVPGGEIDRR
jgi:threonine dehydrogenase-like Zn-dependent dehydrogenase